MRRHPRTTRLLAPALALGLVASGAACSSNDDTAQQASLGDLQLIGALQPVDSCETLLDRLQVAALDRVGPYGFDSGGPFVTDTFAADTAEGRFSSVGGDVAQAPAPTSPTTTTPGVSGTNVQEAGVDEPDLVKADGERILAIAGGELHWIDITGDQPVDAGTVDLPEGYGHQLLVAGDKAVVMVTGDGGPIPIEGDLASSFVPGGFPLTTTVVQVDLSSPESMAVTDTLEVEGSILDARLVGDTARVVVSSPPENLNFVYPSNASPEGEQIAEDANRRIIEDSAIEDWMPAYRHLADPEGADEAVVDEGSLVECDRMSTPTEFSGFGTLSVLTFDVPGELGTGDGVGVLATGENVYASTDHLYVATTAYPAPEETDESDESDESEDPDTSDTTTSPETPETTDTADDVESTSTTVPPQDFNDFPEAPPTPVTAIHRFSIDGEGPAEYERSGQVRGRLLDQFSMSEAQPDDLLRVATTDDATQESYVTVLQDNGAELAELGQVGDLGEDEQIYSVRFVGDVGYVVTFRQTDPLYTIDLSDPTAPAVTGELKILGYSAYLHPIGDDLLLGIGQDATAEGQTTGTQLSLFDVSDPANPTRLQQATLPGASSEAEYDHHAFLYWPETDLAVLPIQTYAGADVVACTPDAPCPAQEYFSGAVGFAVDTDGIGEVGRITHDDGSVLTRSIVVGDTLYTLSDSSLVSSDLATLAPRATLPLS